MEALMVFTLTSSAFRDGDSIPVRHTCDGSNVSPPLVWKGAPEAAAGFALVVDDPDAPSGTFTHWLLLDIPASRSSLPEGRAAAQLAPEGTNGFRTRGYGGPCPPRGHGPHRYRFHLHALREPLNLAAGCSRADVDRALEGRVLATTVLVGRYERT
jgi:Raf kinase inhibitor-like YbhB/YbcL family protein